MVCSNSVVILHNFRNIATFTVHVTVCDLETFFSFDKTIEISGRIRFSIRLLHSLVKLVTH